MSGAIGPISEAAAQLLNKLFGGFCEQVGGWLEDGATDFRLQRRRKRIDKILRKIQTASDEAGFEPHAVPDYILYPALQEASLQDDELLQDMWANLIANAADPRNDGSVPPVFVAILRELAPYDAGFLDKFADAPPSPHSMIGYFEVMLSPFHPTDSEEALRLTLDTLQRSRLLSQQFQVSQPDPSAIPGSSALAPTYAMSDLGVAFVAACRAPKK